MPAEGDQLSTKMYNATMRETFGVRAACAFLNERSEEVKRAESFRSSQGAVTKLKARSGGLVKPCKLLIRRAGSFLNGGELTNSPDVPTDTSQRAAAIGDGSAVRCSISRELHRIAKGDERRGQINNAAHDRSLDPHLNRSFAAADQQRQERGKEKVDSGEKSRDHIRQELRVVRAVTSPSASNTCAESEAGEVFESSDQAVPRGSRQELVDAKMAKAITKSTATQYTHITAGSVSEFIPSRPTRQSENPALQQHCSDMRKVMQERGLDNPNRKKSPSAEQSLGELRGKYVDLDLEWIGEQECTGDNGHAQSRTRSQRGGSTSSNGHLEQSKHYENLIRAVNPVHEQAWLASARSASTPQLVSNTPRLSGSSSHGSVSTPDLGEGKMFGSPKDQDQYLAISNARRAIIRSVSSESCCSTRSSEYEEMLVDGTADRGQAQQAHSTSGSQNVRYRKRHVTRRRADHSSTGRVPSPDEADSSQNLSFANLPASLQRPGCLSTPSSPTPTSCGSAPSASGRSFFPFLSMADGKSRSSDSILQLVGDKNLVRRRLSDPSTVRQKRYGQVLPESLDMSYLRSPSPTTPEHVGMLELENIPSPAQWRKSSVEELFGTFTLEYVGPCTVTHGHGVPDSAFKQVLHRAKKHVMESTQRCIATITASVVQVSPLLTVRCGYVSKQSMSVFP